jgi:hypothetical protein
MYRIPSKKNWAQTNDSDVLGEIYASFNVDLTANVGRLTPSPRLLINTSSADDSDIGVPVAIKSIADKNYFIAGAKVFTNGLNIPSSGFSENGISGVPTNLNSNYSDMTDFNGYLYVTSNSTSVYKTDGSTWSNFVAGGSTGAMRLLMQFGDRTYMSDGTSKIISWNTADSVATIGNQYTIDFSSNANSRLITFMRASASRVWIGTMNRNGGKGTIYEWDGSSTQATRSFRLEASAALACVIKDDIPWVMDSNGSLLAYDGGSFRKISSFNRKSKKMLYGALNTSPTARFIHHNGMSIIDGDIHMLINGSNYDNATTIEDTIPSGVYSYTKDSGITHKYSFGLSKSGDSITDYGQVKISKVGALSDNNIPETSSTRNGTFLAGCEFYTDATTTKSAIFYDDSNDTLQKSMIVTFPKVDSPNVDELWQKGYAKISRFRTASDKMVVKYRTTYTPDVEATITWTGTTTLTSTSDLSTFAVGDEMTVIQGKGSGKPSHITAISYSAPTYTITVDETYSGASGTAKAKFDKWIKCGSLSNQVSTYLQYPIGKASNWIQIKLWITCTGGFIELEEILLIHASNQSLK